MRVAVLADIHGNLPAFEAALGHVNQQKPDLVVIAGDIVNGAPDSAACWNLARSLGWPLLRGNHERYIYDYGTGQASPDWSTERFAPVQWTQGQFNQQDRQEMAALPTCLRLPEAPDLVVVHAAEINDSSSVRAHTPPEQLQQLFPTFQERYIIRAHNHNGLVRVWDGKFIVTSGSVGLALDGSPTAQYLLLDQEPRGWRIQHQSVPYDLEAAIKRFRDTGYLASTGPMGRLFLREVVTATQQLVPFLRLYAHWSAQGPLSLAEAVDRFLNAY
jgi:predicted phosphodiesterase